MTTAPLKLELRQLSLDQPDDVSKLQGVLESAPAYWKLISNKVIEADGATEIFKMLPEGKTYSDKFVFGIFRSGACVGCIDLIRGYPDSETAMLGLLLISESRQKMGLGRAAYSEIEKFVRTWSGVRKVRIGVVGTNSSALLFWKTLGFLETGVRRPYEDNGVISETIVLEKNIYSLD